MSNDENINDSFSEKLKIEIELSSLQLSDAPALYALFATCFPVVYPYEDISNLCVPSKKYFTVCVVKKMKSNTLSYLPPSHIKNFEETSGNYVVTSINNFNSLIVPVLVEYVDNKQNSELNFSNSYLNNNPSREIYGFGIIQFENISQIPKEGWKIFSTNISRRMKVAHLLSFGFFFFFL